MCLNNVSILVSRYVCKRERERERDRDVEGVYYKAIEKQLELIYKVNLNMDYRGSMLKGKKFRRLY